MVMGEEQAPSPTARPPGELLEKLIILNHRNHEVLFSIEGKQEKQVGRVPGKDTAVHFSGAADAFLSSFSTMSLEINKRRW